MAANIEVKARLADLPEALQVARRISDAPMQELHQVDYFFPCKNGRLKLRVFARDEGELIFYNRPDAATPRRSEYTISKTEDAQNLCHCLKQALGMDLIVEKTRFLFRLGPMRIHIDQVKNLGNFLELEVVLANDKPKQEEALSMIRQTLAEFGVQEKDLLPVAYRDLLEGELKRDKTG
jgi:predicted adenylyl cyclase CyaB